MEVKQLWQLVNATTQEVLGETAVVNEDLSNLVDTGKAVFDANQVDNYVKKLVDHIGRVIFVNRPYSGSAPSVLRDAWEFGSVLEKIRSEMPTATANESWDLVDGQSYDPNVFHKPEVSAKFYNSKITFEIEMSFVEMQLKSAFSNATQMNAFVSMLYNEVDKALTVRTDALIQRTINNMIAETIHADYGSADLGSKSGTKAINVLYLYNQEHPDATLTKDNCFKNPDFVRFFSYKMGLTGDRLRKISTLFNIGGKERFTPSDKLHTILLSDIAKAADSYLQSDVFHNEFVALPKAETVPYWQGSGTDYEFSSTSKIDVKTSENNTVEVSGILGVMFDHDALGVCNENRRTTSNYNPKAEFYNNWFKTDASYYNDFDENFVVFFVADQGE